MSCAFGPSVDGAPLPVSVTQLVRVVYGAARRATPSALRYAVPYAASRTVSWSRSSGRMSARRTTGVVPIRATSDSWRRAPGRSRTVRGRGRRRGALRLRRRGCGPPPTRGAGFRSCSLGETDYRSYEVEITELCARRALIDDERARRDRCPNPDHNRANKPPSAHLPPARYTHDHRLGHHQASQAGPRGRQAERNGPRASGERPWSPRTPPARPRDSGTGHCAGVSSPCGGRPGRLRSPPPRAVREGRSRRSLARRIRWSR